MNKETKIAKENIWKGIGFIVLGFICLSYGVLGMEAGQVYYVENNLKGIFFMFISMFITFIGFFGLTFHGFFTLRGMYKK